MSKNKLHFKLLRGAFWFFDQMSAFRFLSPLTLKPKLYLGTLLLVSPYFASSGPKKQSQKTIPNNASQNIGNQSDFIEEVTCYETFVSVENPPIFPGQEDSLTKFISEKLIYPQAAKEQKISGRVYV